MSIFDAQQILPTILQPTVGLDIQQMIIQALLGSAGFSPGTSPTFDANGQVSAPGTQAQLKPQQVDMSKTLFPWLMDAYKGGMPSGFTPQPLSALQQNDQGAQHMYYAAKNGYSDPTLQNNATNLMMPFLHPGSGGGPAPYAAPQVSAPPVQWSMQPNSAWPTNPGPPR